MTNLEGVCTIDTGSASRCFSSNATRVFLRFYPEVNSKYFYQESFYAVEYKSKELFRFKESEKAKLVYDKILTCDEKEANRLHELSKKQIELHDRELWLSLSSFEQADYIWKKWPSKLRRNRAGVKSVSYEGSFYELDVASYQTLKTLETVIFRREVAKIDAEILEVACESRPLKYSSTDASGAES